jgi:hypothetical protein
MGKPMIRKTTAGLLAAVALLTAAGCTNPNDPTQRAVGGGLLGAGGGAAIGALAGGGRGAAIGALTGGVLGAGAGILTTPQAPAPAYAPGYAPGYGQPQYAPPPPAYSPPYK